MRGPERHREGGRLLQGDTVRYGEDRGGVGDGLFRHGAAAHGHARDAVADLDPRTNVRAALGDHARELPARDERQSGLLLILTLYHQQVGEVEGGSLDFDLDAIARASRRRDVLDGERATRISGLGRIPQRPAQHRPHLRPVSL